MTDHGGNRVPILNEDIQIGQGGDDGTGQDRLAAILPPEEGAADAGTEDCLCYGIHSSRAK